MDDRECMKVPMNLEKLLVPISWLAYGRFRSRFEKKALKIVWIWD